MGRRELILSRSWTHTDPSLMTQHVIPYHDLDDTIPGSGEWYHNPFVSSNLPHSTRPILVLTISCLVEPREDLQWTWIPCSLLYVSTLSRSKVSVLT
jgi:hypothetical protein